MSNYFGFSVSDELREIWSVEQGLLDEFVRVCEKNNLNYFLDGGTLLGAVRHQGFIPWDDDVDVIMPRYDYDKLWEIAADEFKHPYFFQTTLSENGFFRTHAQLRNSDTTGFVVEDGEKPQINKGIFLDVFCLDNIPDNKFERNLLRLRIRLHKAILSYQYDRPFDKISWKSKMFYIFVHVIFSIIPFKSYFKFFNNCILGSYKNKETKLVGDITLKWRENVQWPREWWDDYVLLEFEGKKYRAPIGYDRILERQYGDYMKIPEDISAKNEKSHGEIVFDVNTPFREWGKRNV